MSVAFPLPFVRAQFPALGGEWAYLDNAGGSQILGRVIDRVVDYWRTSNVQLGASYERSRVATERVDAARADVAWLMGAKDARGVVLGSSTTQLVHNLAGAMAARLAPGDEIVVTSVDHEANIGAWRRLAARGVVLKEWRIREETLRLEPADLAPLLSPRTRLVCFTHCSNVVGTIHPVAEITRMVHAHGAKVCVDGVAYAPHRALMVDAWDVDYYVFSLYKVYGPHMAALYGKPELLAALDGPNHFFVANDDLPYKMQPGGVNHELSHGLGGIRAYLTDLAHEAGTTHPFDAIARHEAALAERLLAFLRGKRGVRILGRPDADPEARVPTISFVAEGHPSPSIPPHADTQRIGIRFGDFYARHLIEQLGLTAHGGVVRVSMVHYNTPAEVDRLVEVLDRVL
jgi:cysteine desulfurase family protein (TIGR01976 family)